MGEIESPHQDPNRGGDNMNPDLICSHAWYEIPTDDLINELSKRVGVKVTTLSPDQEASVHVGRAGSMTTKVVWKDDGPARIIVVVDQKMVEGVDGKMIPMNEDHYMNPNSKHFDPDAAAHDPDRRG